MKKILLALTILFCIVGFSQQKTTKGKRGKSPAVAAGTIGCKAPSLAKLQIVKGKPIKKIDSKKVYVIEFWATWCPPCVQQIPHLSKIQKEFGKDVVVISIHSKSGGDFAKVSKFVKDRGDMHYTVAIDPEGSVSKLLNDFGVKGIPHAFVAKGGKIVWSGHPGVIDAQIKKALAGEPEDKKESTEK